MNYKLTTDVFWTREKLSACLLIVQAMDIHNIAFTHSLVLLALYHVVLTVHYLSSCTVPCDEGVSPVECLVDPCAGASCRQFPDAKCASDYCGGCNARWFQDGQEVECESTYVQQYIFC